MEKEKAQPSHYLEMMQHLDAFDVLLNRECDFVEMSCAQMDDVVMALQDRLLAAKDMRLRRC